MRPFRILLVGHGKLPAALLASAELITGELEDIAAVSLHAHETPEHFVTALQDAAGADERAVLILTDLLGGTPHNVAAALARRDPRLTCVSGVNLGMLLEAALGLDSLEAPAVARLVAVGRNGISAISATGLAAVPDGRLSRAAERPKPARRAS